MSTGSNPYQYLLSACCTENSAVNESYSYCPLEVTYMVFICNFLHLYVATLGLWGCRPGHLGHGCLCSGPCCCSAGRSRSTPRQRRQEAEHMVHVLSLLPSFLFTSNIHQHTHTTHTSTHSHSSRVSVELIRKDL